MRLIGCVKKRMLIFLGVICVFWTLSLEAAVDPVVVELHYQNGVRYYKRGLYEKAVQEFEKTLSYDPAHKGAAVYLKRVASIDEKKNRVDAKKSQNEEIRKLYDEGRSLYKKRDYEGAIEVFDKILKLKPVDDFASYYKERCEIFISRRLAREKRLEEKRILKEAKARRRQEKQAVRQKGRQLQQERRGAQEKAAFQARGNRELSIDKTRQTDTAQEERLRQMEEMQERRDFEKQERQKREAHSLSQKVEAQKVALERKKVKELYLSGAEFYGRKAYDKAIAAFEMVVEAEAGGPQIYSNAARRLMQKAKEKNSKVKIQKSK